jgi:hypothetical protein
MDERYYIKYTASSPNVKVDFIYEREVDGVGQICFELISDKETNDICITAILTGKPSCDTNTVCGRVTEIVKKLILLLSCRMLGYISQPKPTQSNLPESNDWVKKSNGWQRVDLPDGTVSYARLNECAAYYSVSRGSSHQVVDFLTSQFGSDSYLWEEYYSALSCIEPVARYMMLYNILLQIYNDKQDLVDDAIESLDNGVRLFKKPTIAQSKKRTTETITTKTRNQIAHKRDGLTIDKAIDDARQNVSNLSYMTFRLIKQKLDSYSINKTGSINNS